MKAINEAYEALSGDACAEFVEPPPSPPYGTPHQPQPQTSAPQPKPKKSEHPAATIFYALIGIGFIIKAVVWLFHLLAALLS